MSLRFLIPFIRAATLHPAIFAQDKNQPTVEELVAKNIEAKGGATALKSLQTLRSTGKLLVPYRARSSLAISKQKSGPMKCAPRLRSRA